MLELHVKIDDAPEATDAGDAVNVTVGRGRIPTVTAAGTLTPPAPAQVSEYPLATLSGPVLWLPLAASAPLQLPDAVHESAFVEFQVKTELPPAAMFMGSAARVTVGSAFTRMAMLAGWLVPPAPVQVNE